MTSSHQLKQGVSDEMANHRLRFGHTQTSYRKADRRSPCQLYREVRSKCLSAPRASTTSYSGGGLIDQERIPALQPRTIRHQREDSDCQDEQSQQAQHQLPHRLDTQVSQEDTDGTCGADATQHHRGSMRPFGCRDVGIGSDARPRALIHRCAAHSQALGACQTNQRIKQSPDAKDALGSPSAWLRQAVEEVEESLGERLLLRERRTRQPRCGEALHLGATTQAERVRIQHLRGQQRNYTDSRLHTKQAGEVV